MIDDYDIMPQALKMRSNALFVAICVKIKPASASRSMSKAVLYMYDIMAAQWGGAAFPAWFSKHLVADISRTERWFRDILVGYTPQ